jgi:hypothetical protein
MAVSITRAYKNFLFQNPLFCPSLLRRRGVERG